MVTFNLKVLRSGVAMCGAVLLLFLAQASSAVQSSVELASGLKVSLPDPLVIEVLGDQPESYGPVLVGEIEREPGYFLAATEIRVWERNHILWKKLEDEIGSRSETGDFNAGVEGRLTTLEGDRVWYKAYEFQADGVTHRHVYYLLKGERSSYWITLTMVEGVDIGLAIPLAEALVRRAQINDERRRTSR